MTDNSHLTLQRIASRVPVPEPAYDRLLRRRDRKERNRRLSAAALAIAVAILSIAGLIRAFGNSERPATQPTLFPTSTVAPPTVPGFELPMSGVRRGQLDPGTYAYLDVGGQGFNVRFTVPAGWTWNGRYLSKGGVGLPDGAAIYFYGGPVRVYADPCHWAGAQSDPPTGLSVQDVMTALAAQPSRNATTPIDHPANVPGIANRWPGMVVELTVPDVAFATCDQGQFRSWGPKDNARSNQGPGQRDLVWAVDLTGNGVDQGGERLIIDAASFPGTPADVMSEIEAILGSVAVGHWG